MPAFYSGRNCSLEIRLDSYGDFVYTNVYSRSVYDGQKSGIVKKPIGFKRES